MIEYEKAIEVLEREKICIQRQTIPCNRDCANCDLVLPDSVVLAAYNTAISALTKQQERDKPKPLTLEQLQLRVGKWVWLYFPGSPICDVLCTKCRGIKGEYAFFFDNGRHTNFYADNYGETWIAYDHQPKEVT